MPASADPARSTAPLDPIPHLGPVDLAAQLLRHEPGALAGIRRVHYARPNGSCAGHHSRVVAWPCTQTAIGDALARLQVDDVVVTRAPDSAAV